MSHNKNQNIPTYSNIKPNNVLFQPIRPECVIFIGGFDELVNEEILYNTCVPFGNVVQVLIPVNPFSNEVHRGFGFVEFEAKLDAMEAIDNLHQSELFGKVLKVTVSKTIHMREGSTRAIWEEEDWLEKYGNTPQSETSGPPKINQTN